jgi:putative flippase GtrA
VREVIFDLRGPAGKNAKGQLIRYGIVVGVGYLLAVAVYAGELAAGVPPYAGLGVAFVLNALFNFALLRLWAFPPSGATMRSDFTRFCLVAAASFVVNYSVFAVLYSVLGLEAATAQRLGIIVAAPITFIANRTWSFRTRQHKAVPHADEEDASASIKKDSYSRM